MNNVMQIVIKAVNFVRAKGLNHCQFQEFLKFMDADYGDIIYFSEVRWLNQSEMLSKFYDLQNKVKCVCVCRF